MSDKKSATIAVRTGITTDSQHHAVVPPLYLSTNYEFPEFGAVPKYDYAVAATQPGRCWKVRWRIWKRRWRCCHQLWHVCYQPFTRAIVS